VTLSEWLQKKIRTAKQSQQKAYKALNKKNLDQDSVEYYAKGIAYNEGIEDTCKQLAEKFPLRKFDLDFISTSFNCPN
jgi:16S rRNA U516 pseudouridylate synthase RsuA-like enzyme